MTEIELTYEMQKHANEVFKKLKEYPLSYYSEANINYYLKMWYGYDPEQQQETIGRIVREVNRLMMLNLAEKNPDHQHMKTMSRARTAEATKN